MDIISFIGGSSVIAILLVQGLKKLFDKYINKKYSAFVSQVALLLISILIAGIAYFAKYLPEYVLVVGGLIFGAGMGIYDVLKAMGVAAGFIKKNYE